jgi:hypothetical protein
VVKNEERRGVLRQTINRGRAEIETRRQWTQKSRFVPGAKLIDQSEVALDSKIK